MKAITSLILSLLTVVYTAGCSRDSDDPTYEADIAPLISKECASCHRDRGIAPFSLTDPSMAARMATAMAAATATREMPPMPVNNDGSCNTYKNARWLSDEAIALFQRWASAGAPLGNAANAPATQPDTSPKLTGEVTSFDIGVDYAPHPSDGHDDYHCFIVDPKIASDALITGYDIQPGDARVVHHVALFALPDVDAENQAATLDAAENGPGYTCYGAPGVDTVSLLGAWTPGAGATLFPAGTGISFSGGRKVVLQMHYNVPATGGPFSDRSAVRLQISHDPGLTLARLLPVGTRQISLPPQDARATTTAELPLSALAQHFKLPPFTRLKTWGVYPHMHTAGRTLRAVAKDPSGAEQCLTNVDRWDFHWQNIWWNTTPLDISAQSTISLTCGYDTRGRTQPTVFGEGTSDEMCVDALFVTID